MPMLNDDDFLRAVLAKTEAVFAPNEPRPRRYQKAYKQLRARDRADYEAAGVAAPSSNDSHADLHQRERLKEQGLISTARLPGRSEAFVKLTDLGEIRAKRTPREELELLARSASLSRMAANLLGQLAASLCPGCGRKMTTRTSRGRLAYLHCRHCGRRAKVRVVVSAQHAFEEDQKPRL
ncbi:MAG: zinc ribbon domain-containing protein [Gemmataceae bacterium]